MGAGRRGRLSDPPAIEAERGSPRSTHRTVWLAFAATLIVIGFVASVVGYRAVANGDAQQSRQTFVSSAHDIASMLAVTLQHEQDLAFGVSGFVLGDPATHSRQFGTWVSSIDAFSRYPELQGIGEIEVVPAARLSAFLTADDLDHSVASVKTGAASVVPGGARSSYCLLNIWQSRSALPFPSELDFCQTSIGRDLTEIAGSGQVGYGAMDFGKIIDLAIGSPIYQNGIVPTTVAARKRALVGWAGVVVEPSIFESAALRGFPHTAAVLQYDHGAGHASFRAGIVPTGAPSTTINLHHNWELKVFETVPAGSRLIYPNAILLLFAGALLTLVSGVLLYVLGTSRVRAMSLVDERTDQLLHQSLHDSLTGLPNRVLVLDRIGQMLARSRSERTTGAALFIDLDNFKDINDTLGHSGGDQLLVEIACRLRGALRQQDTVGRLGGDEFVVLTEGSEPGGAQQLAERILAVLAAPVTIKGSEVPFTVTASIGIAEGNRHAPEELLRDADIALYRAKAAGKERAIVFVPAMLDAVHDHRSLEVDLRTALAEDQYFLEYQLTVDLSTGEFAGVEALLRWNHVERGVVQPAAFIPTLESSGMIRSVGKWVLYEACQQGARWQRRGYRISMSVNVSARQLERDRIVRDVQAALSATGFDPGLLILELTETTLMRDVQATVALLNSLKALGVRIAIDDFGTGYSSLAYLRQLPIDVLKIDRSFVTGLEELGESAAVIHTLVQLGKVLGLETVAEGVETDGQHEWLSAEGVDVAQGFLFARPTDAETVARRLTARQRSPDQWALLP